jgi:hypothetical protein
MNLGPRTVFASRAARRSLVLLALAVAVSGAAIAAYYQPLTNARWVLPSGSESSLDIEISADLKTRTDRLPPVTAITADRIARVQLEYGSGDHPGSVAVERVTPLGAQVTCPTMQPGQLLVACVAKMQWLRTLTQDTTVQLRAKSMNNQVYYLTWTLVAPPNLVFLNRIEGPTSMIKGTVADFNLVLQQPAPAAGVEVQYQIDPGYCFTGESRAYASQGTVQFVGGQQYRTLTLASTGSCTSGNAILKTWTHERRDQAPYYLTKSFTLLNPRR